MDNEKKLIGTLTIKLQFYDGKCKGSLKVGIPKGLVTMAIGELELMRISLINDALKRQDGVEISNAGDR